MPTNTSDVAFPLPPSVHTVMDSSVGEPRVEVIFIIFFTSLFAASFPTISKQIPILRIPAVVFFIGKHFGTGVILSTAFVHLLDDAFRSLQNPLVRIRYGNIGKWTGLIILGSLLVIFLVEYISTSYVDYLQGKPSAAPTPIASVRPSCPESLKPLSRSVSYENLPRSTRSRRSQQTISTNAELALPTESAFLTETTPLLSPARAATDTFLSSPGQLRREVSGSNVYLTNKSLYSRSRDHSPHRYHHHYMHHVYNTPVIPSAAVTGVPIDVLTNSPRIFRQLSLGHLRVHEHLGPEQANEGECSDGIDDHRGHVSKQYLRVGRGRQVVGLLVLQLGIMIHSLVIGLTLAVTDGSDFMSLTTAILFHQLFEGLSLGIRIASLPPTDMESGMTVKDEENLLTQSPASLLPPTCDVPPITPNHDSDSGAPSNSQIIGAGIEIQSRNNYLWTFREREGHWFKPTLSFLFALTTPFGIGVGMMLWKERGGSDTTQMLLIQGTMSAISAGMLIYVGTVEMIAGDFVFGDLDGGHGHGHGHDHDHDMQPDLHQQPGGSRSRSHNHGDHQLHTTAQSGSDCGDGKQHQGEQSGMKATVAKKILAVLSLFAGAAGMALIGLGE